MKPKNQQKRLQGRREDYSRMIQPSVRHEAKVDDRITSGGFHRPGSNKK